MDEEIRKLLAAFKKKKSQEGKLTPEEEAKFDSVKYGRINRQLPELFPGELVKIEGIDPSSGKIVLRDSHGINYQPITAFGYEIKDVRGKQEYIAVDTIMTRQRKAAKQ